jgi:hypothetical protein
MIPKNAYLPRSSVLSVLSNNITQEIANMAPLTVGIIDDYLNMLHQEPFNFNIEKSCACSSFVLQYDKLEKLSNYLSKIVVKTREESIAMEFVLGRLLYLLNDKKYSDIDGPWEGVICDRPDGSRSYNCFDVDPYKEDHPYYFLKKIQNKTERTVDH